MLSFLFGLHKLNAELLDERYYLSFILGYSDHLRVLGGFLNAQSDTPDSDDFLKRFFPDDVDSVQTYNAESASAEDSNSAQDTLNLVGILGLALRAAKPEKISKYILNSADVSDFSHPLNYALLNLKFYFESDSLASKFT
jgi:hypothetical protein